MSLKLSSIESLSYTRPDTTSESKETTLNIPESGYYGSCNQSDRADVLFLSSIVFFVTMVSCDIWIPYVFDPRGLSPEFFTFSDVFTTLILSVPFSKLINDFGFKYTLLFMCALSISGTAIRCWAFAECSYIAVHVSAIFLSSAKVFIKPLAASITAKYFKRRFPHFTIVFLLSMAMMGTAVGYASKLVVPQALGYDLDEPYQPEEFVMYVMYACLAMSTVCAVSVFAWYPREPIVDASYDSIVPDKSVDFVDDFLANNNLWALTGSYVCSYGFSWLWFQAFKWPWATFQRVPDKEFKEFRIQFNIWVLVQTSLLGLSYGFSADTVFSKHRKCFVAVLQLIAVVVTLGLFAFQTQNEYYDLIHLVIIFWCIGISWSTQGVLLEYTVSLPATRSLTVGTMEMANAFCQALVYVFYFFKPQLYLDNQTVALIIGQVLSLVCLMTWS